MKFTLALLFGAAASAFGAAAVRAQDPDKEAAKKKILEQVEKRLKSEEEKLLKDLEKVIEEELGGKKVEPPKPVPPKAEPAPPKPAPAPARKARGYLGIRGADLSDDEKKALGIKGGLKITEVVPDAPAAKAGLKVDDVLTSLDGRAIDTSQDVQVIVGAAGPGTKLKAEYLREGKKNTAEITLARNPQDPPEEAPKKEDPKAEDLRERVKKFLQKEEPPKQEEPKPKPPSGDAEGPFALDEEMFDQLKGLLEQFGMEPDQYFEKGKDGKYRLNSELRDLFKGLNLDKLKDLLPGGNKPAPEPAPKKPEPPKKVEPKAEPKPSAPRAWLGFQPEEVSEELRAQLDLEDGVGLLMVDVILDGPSHKGGLKKNDIITKIDGKPAKGLASLDKFMESARPGQEATLTILRKGKEQTVKVTLGEKKD